MKTLCDLAEFSKLDSSRILESWFESACDNDTMDKRYYPTLFPVYLTIDDHPHAAHTLPVGFFARKQLKILLWRDGVFVAESVCFVIVPSTSSCSVWCSLCAHTPPLGGGSESAGTYALGAYHVSVGASVFLRPRCCHRAPLPRFAWPPHPLTLLTPLPRRQHATADVAVSRRCHWPSVNIGVNNS